MYEQLAPMARDDTDEVDSEGQITGMHQLLPNALPKEHDSTELHDVADTATCGEANLTKPPSVRSLVMEQGLESRGHPRPMIATVAATMAVALVFYAAGTRLASSIVPQTSGDGPHVGDARGVASAAEVRLPMEKQEFVDEDAVRPKNITIQWAKDPRKCLDVGGNQSGANLQLWHCAPEDSAYKDQQRFILPQRGGTGFIRWAAHPELCLDAPGGQDLQFWACRVAPAKNMLFTVSPDGRGRIHLASFPHLCVNVPKMNKNGEKAVMWNCSDMAGDDETGRTKFVTERRDCKWSTWSQWSVCSVSCGGGMFFRSRKVLQRAVNGGNACGIEADESKSCAEESCHGGDASAKKSAGLRSATLRILVAVVCTVLAFEWMLWS